MEIDLREHQGTQWAAALQTQWATTKVAKGGLPGADCHPEQALR